MRRSAPILFKLFANPAEAKDFSLEQWSECLKQAYKTGSVARVFACLRRYNLADCIPEQLSWHFTSADRMKQAQARDSNYTINKLSRHLASFKGQVILLKGAAYAVSDDTCVGEGRLFSDIDIYVDHENIDTVEQLLKWSGWEYDEEKSEYDIDYYRNWMHELPPLVNKTLPLMLDVHHHLVPIISRQCFDISALTKTSDVTTHSQFNVLVPEAQLIHTALHMLTNDDMTNITRDLLDFYLNYTANKSRVMFDMSSLVSICSAV